MSVPVSASDGFGPGSVPGSVSGSVPGSVAGSSCVIAIVASPRAPTVTPLGDTIAAVRARDPGTFTSVLTETRCSAASPAAQLSSNRSAV